MYDVLGIGNPLIDILVDVDEGFIASFSLRKGQFHLFSEKDINKVMDAISDKERVIAPGDSTANTLSGISAFGGRCIFFGNVGNDGEGEYYEKTLRDHNIEPKLRKANEATGKAICLITPDGQRTFVVNLGASLTLRPEDIDEEAVNDSKIIHLTGYQLEDPGLRKTSEHLMKLAKKYDKPLSVDFADAGIITRNRELMHKILKEADIVFANEGEAEALTGDKEFNALAMLGKHSKLAALKLGENGSLIHDRGAIITIEPFKADTIDTTGAGDTYAAGILYGLTHDLDMETSGMIASYAAAKVVESKGARLTEEVRRKVLSFIDSKMRG